MKYNRKFQQLFSYHLHSLNHFEWIRIKVTTNTDVNVRTENTFFLSFFHFDVTSCAKLKIKNKWPKWNGKKIWHAYTFNSAFNCIIQHRFWCVFCFSVSLHNLLAQLWLRLLLLLFSLLLLLLNIFFIALDTCICIRA